MSSPSARPLWAWAFYDWANSAYACTVMAGFFPIFFKQYWSAGASVTESTLYLGIANSSAGIVIVLLAPLLGAIADCGQAKKKFLFVFMALGTLMTAALYLVERGAWQWAVGCYVLASVGFLGGNIFYDALLINIASHQRRHFVSALGYGLGYLGGGVLFAMNVVMTLNPGWFGFADAGAAVRVSFISVALWWLIFSLPLFLWVRESSTVQTKGGVHMVRAGFRQLINTFHEVRRLRVVALFLAGYWLYIDGVDTIIVMAVDYGMSLGFDSNSLIVALLITQFVGFPAALVFGKIGERWGGKRAILVAIGIYVLITLWAYQMKAVAEFYLLAGTVGLVQGGIQALSRSLYSRIIPADKAAEFFGFYNMVGKFAAVLGPLLIGVVGVMTGDSRQAILSVIALFAVGALLLSFVNEAEGRRAAETMESTGSKAA